MDDFSTTRPVEEDAGVMSPDRGVGGDGGGKLTKAQLALLTYLSASGEWEACERVCHPNTAAALERRGLLIIEDGDGSFRPWFDCRIKPSGRAALPHHAPAPEDDQ